MHTIRNKSFVFKSTYDYKVKSHDCAVAPINCPLPKPLQNGEFLSEGFRLFNNYLSNSL